MKICAAHRANVAPSLGFFAGRGSSLASARTPFSENNMNVETKAVGYAIYDAPAKLKAFRLIFQGKCATYTEVRRHKFTCSI